MLQSVRLCLADDIKDIILRGQELTQMRNNI